MSLVGVTDDCIALRYSIQAVQRDSETKVLRAEKRPSPGLSVWLGKVFCQERDHLQGLSSFVDNWVSIHNLQTV